MTESRVAKDRFMAVREWGNKWTLFDSRLGKVLIAKSENRAMVLDTADHLNKTAVDCSTIEEVRERMRV